jgi:hypothetical protein
MAKASIISESSANALPTLMQALTQLAILRGARMDKTMLAHYAKRLAQENTNDVCRALSAMEEKPRQAGESALPEIGVILAAVETEKRIRLAAASAEAQERFVRWQCPVCKVTASGWLKPGESRERYCYGIPRRPVYERGEICGGTLEVVAELLPELKRARR